jgi:hypothetical protein
MSKDEGIRQGLPDLATTPKTADGVAAAGVQQPALPGATPMAVPSNAPKWPPWVISGLAVFAVVAPVTVMGLLTSMQNEVADEKLLDPTCPTAPASLATTAPPASASISIADAAAPQVSSAASTEPAPPDAAAPSPASSAASSDAGGAPLATETPDAGKRIKVKPAQLPPEVF